MAGHCGFGLRHPQLVSLETQWEGAGSSWFCGGAGEMLGPSTTALDTSF